MPGAGRGGGGAAGRIRRNACYFRPRVLVLRQPAAPSASPPPGGAGVGRRAELCDDALMGLRDSRTLVIWSWVVLALLAAHDVTHLLDDGLETSPGRLASVALPQWL